MRARFVVPLVALVPALVLASVPRSGADESVSTTNITSTGTVTPGQRLDIRLETGAGLKITGWDRSEVAVNTGGYHNHCPGAVIALTKTADGAQLESHYDPEPEGERTCSLMIEVRVPKRFSVRVSSSGGSIELVDVQGTFEGRTGGGTLSLQRLKGRVDLTTGGGGIEVRDSDLEGKVSTGGGSVNFQNVSGPLTGTSGSMSHVVHGRSRTI